MTTWLHRKRLEAAHAAVMASGARRIVDIGCGDGDLLVRLAQEPSITRITGLDVSRSALAQAGERLAAVRRDGGPEVELRLGSVLSGGACDASFDCAILLEVIEHINPDRLSQLEQALFGATAPAVILITTPNAEYNPLLGVPPHRFRHPDHRFEWTRARFQSWAAGIAARNAYTVTLADIAGSHPRLGGPSQMALFRRPDVSRIREMS